MSWIEVRASFPPLVQDVSASELGTIRMTAAVGAFLEHGVENTLESTDTLTGALANVDGVAQVLESLERSLLGVGADKVEIRDLPEENWDEVWRQFFKPRRVGDRLIVKPTWAEIDATENDVVIELDPGQAFGTGDHATTRLCLELLEPIAAQCARVLDVGCGSGVLSIAAAKLGSQEVVAIDIDPISVEVTRVNANHNSVSLDALVGNGLKVIPAEAKFDLILSNIISATLIRLAWDIGRLCHDRSIWIVSGIIEPNWPDVLHAAERAGFHLVELKQEEDWVAAKLIRTTAL